MKNKLEKIMGLAAIVSLLMWGALISGCGTPNTKTVTVLIRNVAPEGIGYVYGPVESWALYGKCAGCASGEVFAAQIEVVVPDGPGGQILFRDGP